MDESISAKPKVSVIVLTHNHEAFLAQALDSILAQEVAFAYEIIIGEDGSVDNTRRIVEDYHQRHPTLIKPIYNARNEGVGANVRACFHACQGQYLATLEGDDYWSDPQKLQTQVAWLDAHPDFTICFHRFAVRTERAGQLVSLSSESPELLAGEQTIFGFADFLSYLVPHVSTVVLRQVWATLPDWLFAVYPIDMPLLALYAEHGKAKLLPGIRSVYRVHTSGNWSGISRQRRVAHYIHMYKQLHQHYAGTPHQALVERKYVRIYLTMAHESLLEGNLTEARQLIRLFWTVDASYRSKIPLLKSLLSVSLRGLRGYLRAQLPKPAATSPAAKL